MADMVLTPARGNLTPIVWQNTFYKEFIRTNQFSQYMGTSDGAMIQVKRELTRQHGDSIVFAATRRLVGAGVTGSTTLEGQEEILNQRSMRVTISVIRHAVATDDWDLQKSTIDILEAARSSLMSWEQEKLRSDTIIALYSIPADGDVWVPYGSASAAQKNAWTANNADRVLFGALRSNNAANVHATSLTNIDNTADKMTGSLLSTAKRLAMQASPHITPIRIEDGTEWYICFMNSLVFRDFRNDPAVQQALRDAWTRGEDNPLFSNGDLLWDGVIVRQIPEIPVVANAGAGGTTDVAASFLCGAQALALAWGQTTKVIENVRDYGFQHGAGIMEIRGMRKMVFGKDPTVDTTAPVDNGVFTIWTAAVADA